MGTAVTVVNSKTPAMIVETQVDFGPALRTGESFTAANVAVTVKRRDTGEDTTAAMLDGADTVSGTVVTQRVKAGTDGVDYLVHFVVEPIAPNNRREEADLVLPVRLRPWGG